MRSERIIPRNSFFAEVRKPKKRAFRQIMFHMCCALMRCFGTTLAGNASIRDDCVTKQPLRLAINQVIGKKRTWGLRSTCWHERERKLAPNQSHMCLSVLMCVNRQSTGDSVHTDLLWGVPLPCSSSYVYTPPLKNVTNINISRGIIFRLIPLISCTRQRVILGKPGFCVYLTGLAIT